MIEWLVFSVLILGALFVLISAIGLLRLPDLYMRMHATTKTTSMGVTLILAGIIMAYPEVTIVIKGFLIIIFIFLTAPLGTHMISKAGHLLHIKKWDRYVEDDMEEAQGNG